MIPSYLSRSAWTLSKSLILSLSSKRFLSKTRSFASRSSIFLLDAWSACVVGRDTFLDGSPVSDGVLSFSNAALLARKGLASSSLLPFCGESTPLSPGALFSAPDCEPGEFRFEVSGRDLAAVFTESRPLAGLVPAVRAAAVEDTDGWRPGLAGGPMDDRVALVEAARVFAAAPPLAFAGVPVREVDALEVAVPSCLVGDLVGDYEQTECQHLCMASLGELLIPHPCNARRT